MKKIYLALSFIFICSIAKATPTPDYPAGSSAIANAPFTITASTMTFGIGSALDTSQAITNLGKTEINGSFGQFGNLWAAGGTTAFPFFSSAVSVSTTLANAGTDYLLNISSSSGVTAFGIQNNSHIVSSGTVNPGISSCGTGSPTVNGTDAVGIITTGGGSPTACTITFTSPYVNTPVCLCGANGATACDPTTISKTSVIFTLGATETAINYICIGNKG